MKREAEAYRNHWLHATQRLPVLVHEGIDACVKLVIRIDRPVEEVPQKVGVERIEREGVLAL